MYRVHGLVARNFIYALRCEADGLSKLRAETLRRSLRAREEGSSFQFAGGPT